MFPINPAMMFNQIRNTSLGNPAQLLGGANNVLSGASPLGQALSSLANPLGTPQITATPSIGNGTNLPSPGTSNAIAPAGQSAPAGQPAPIGQAAPAAQAAPMGAAEGGGKKKKCKKGKKKCDQQIMQQLQQLQQGQAQMQDQLKRIEGRLDQMGQLNPAMQSLLASSMGKLPGLGMGAGFGMGLPQSPYTAALGQLQMAQLPAMAMPAMPVMPQLPALAQPAMASAGNAARLYFEQTKLMMG
jgi:hypothetical protein